MLVLTRKAGEKIVIGDDIVVTILDVRGDGIRIGIDAPRGVKIQREEVLIAVAEANMSAALVDDAGADQIKSALGLTLGLPLDHHCRRAPLVSVSNLFTEILRRAQEHFGPNARTAEFRRHLLVIGNAILIHNQNHHRPGRLGSAEIAGEFQRMSEARHADREAGCGDGLGTEARDEAIISPAAANRAEHNLLALLIGDGEGQFDLEDRAGVVFEAADDGTVNANAIGAVAGCFDQAVHRPEFASGL